MSWALVAKKDFEDVVRSGMFWAIMLTSLLFLSIVFFGVTTGDTDEAGQVVIYELINSVGAQILLPLLALIFGYLAIAGERESGTLRVLFGLRHSRRDVVLGKLLSRAAIMTVASLLVTAVVGVLILVQFDTFGTADFLVFAGLTLLLVLSFLGIAIGVSATASTRLRAMAGAIGSYVVLFMLWYPLSAMVHYAVEGELAAMDAPDWYMTLLALNPLNLYRYTLGDQIGDYLGTFVGWPAVVEDITAEQIAEEPTAMLLANRGTEGAFYTSAWFAVAVFLAWFAIPILLGHWRFQRNDLS